MHRVVLRHVRACKTESPRARRELASTLASLAHFAARASRPKAFLCTTKPTETRTHHAENSSVLVSHPRDHNCSAVVIPNMPGQLHFGPSIPFVPRIPFLQDHGRLLRLLLRIGWPVLRVHIWHDMFEHPDLVPH